MSALAGAVRFIAIVPIQLAWGALWLSRRLAHLADMVEGLADTVEGLPQDSPWSRR